MFRVAIFAAAFFQGQTEDTTTMLQALQHSNDGSTFSVDLEHGGRQVQHKLKMNDNCKFAALACGMDWSDGVPAGYSNWLALQDGFTTCCEVGGHRAGMCSVLAAEIFERVNSTEFPNEGGSFDGAFCHELSSLVAAHEDWSSLGGKSLVQLDRNQAQTMITQKLALLQASLPTVFEHWVALGLGASSVALSQISSTAAVAAVGAAVAAHLQTCGGTECDKQRDRDLQNCGPGLGSLKCREEVINRDCTATSASTAAPTVTHILGDPSYGTDGYVGAGPSPPPPEEKRID